jgi:hypothetical protein
VGAWAQVMWCGHKQRGERGAGESGTASAAWFFIFFYFLEMASQPVLDPAVMPPSSPSS